LGVDEETSQKITDQINQGDVTQKPELVRISLHPTSTDEQAKFIVNAVKQVVDNAEEWSQDYSFKTCSGEFELREKPTYKSIDDFNPMGMASVAANGKEGKSLLSWFK
jgi:hypothetical protein